MILIKDSLVIDGTGSPGERKDILIKDNKISAIGVFPNHDADIVIDGLGLVSTPGFIDINTDSDHYLSLFNDQSQHDFLLQGVTTILGGQSGSSLAPLIRGTLESIRKWTDTNQINVDWNTVGEFLKTLDKLKLGVNFGTLVGHSTIRRGIIGEENRELTKDELAVFKELLRQALKDGAFGLSIGLRYNHAAHATYEEISALVSVVAKGKGLFASHLRNEGEKIIKAVDEIIQIAEETKVRTVISHFRAMKGFEEKFKKAFSNLEKAAENKYIDIQFDGYPFNYSIIPIYSLLPDKARKGNIEKMCATINLLKNEKAILAGLPTIRGEDLIIARAAGMDYVVGKTIGEFSKAQELTVKQGILKLMKTTKLKAVLFRQNLNLKETVKALFSEHGFIASNSPSQVETHNILTNERAATTFSQFLELVEESKDHTLEWAISKVTQKPAQLLNLSNRGVLKEGNIADIVLLDKAKAIHVFVGGKQVVKHGVFQDIYNGEILRKK